MNKLAEHGITKESGLGGAILKLLGLGGAGYLGYKGVTGAAKDLRKGQEALNFGTQAAVMAGEKPPIRPQ